jgi:recombination protein RecR
MENVLDHAVRQFMRLPGVGRRTAQRYVYHLLRHGEDQILSLSAAVEALQRDIRPCSQCHALTERDPCAICSDARRESATLCIIGETSEIPVIETTGKYRGRYHVLGGLLNPAGGVGPEKLNLGTLLRRAEQGVQEVIIAFNASVEGDTTALYIARLLRPTGVRVTTLARGLPAGGSLDHADKVTVGLSLDGRTEL